MKPVIIGLLGLVLCASSAVAGPQKAARRSPRRRTATQISYLPEGYYFELTPCVRCYRCAPCALPNGWQRELLTKFRNGHIRAFLAVPYQMNRADVKGVRTLSRIQSYETSIYVGPYESEQAAKQAFKHLCEVASDFGDDCRDWPDKEYSVGFPDGIWASINYVPSPDN